MKIEDRVYVRFFYTFEDENGKEVYSTNDSNPPWYIHGHGLIMPVLEKALEGHEAGDEFSIEIKPEDAFGNYDKKLLKEVNKNALPEDFNPEIGAMLQAEDNNGNIMPVVVIGIEGDMVTLDANHPLAGRNLKCNMKVLEVREPNSIEKGEVARFLGNQPGMSTTVDDDGSIIMEFGSDDNEPVSAENFNVTSGGCPGCAGGCGSDDNNNNGGCSDPGSCCS